MQQQNMITLALSALLLVCTYSVQAGEVKGYYSWNWGSGSTGSANVSPSDERIGVAFTGLVDVSSAIKGYPKHATWCCPELQGSHFLCLGGGNAAGTFTVAALQEIAKQLALIKPANYSGVILDVEQASGSADELTSAFKTVFSRAKGLGLRTAVTTSHSGRFFSDWSYSL